MNLLMTIETMLSQKRGILSDINKDDFMDLLSPLFQEFYRYIFSLAKNRDLTDDIIQNTLLLAYENIHKLRDKSKLKSWLFTIGKREFLRSIRNNSKYTELIDEKIETKELTPESAFLQLETTIEIIININELSPIFRLKV